MGFVAFIEGENYLLTHGDGLPTTCYFLLSTRATSSMTPNNTLAGGIGEITGTGYSRQLQAAPVPTGGTVTFTSMSWNTGSATNWPSNVASVAFVSTADNTGRLICAWDLTAVRNMAQAGTTETVNLSFSLSSTAQPVSQAPTVTAVTPNSGPIAGGTPVTITGTNFGSASSVLFDVVPAASYSVGSATTINATTPAHSAATVNVTVTTPGGTSAQNPADQFTFNSTPTGNYDAVILAESPAPVLYLDGTSATTNRGTKGSGYTLTNHGTTVTAAALPNGDSALTFNGTSNYISIPDPSDGSLSIITNPNNPAKFSYEFWMQLGTLNMPNGTPGIPGPTGDATGHGGIDMISKNLDASPQYDPEVPSTDGNEWQFRYFNANSLDGGNTPTDCCGYIFNGSGGAGAGNDDHIDAVGGGSGPAIAKTTSMWLYYCVVVDMTPQTISGVTSPNGFITLYGGIYGNSSWNGIFLNRSQCLAFTGTRINPVHTTTPLCIGTSGFASNGHFQGSDAPYNLTPGFYQGKISKFAVYNGALTQTQMHNHYLAMSGTPVGNPPTITSITPTSGPTGGNTAVSITGTNLTGPTGATFGGSAATAVTASSATAATATSPAHAAGTVDVQITTPSGTSGTSSADQFTYTGTTTGYDSTIIADGPVMYSTNALATAVGSYTAVNHNGVTQAAMPNGDMAWSFNNAGNQYLSIADPANGALSIGSAGMSFELWWRGATMAQPHASFASLSGGLEMCGKSDYAAGTGCEYCYRFYGSNSTDPTGNPIYNTCFYRFSSSCGIGDGHDDHISPKTAGTWYYALGRYTGVNGIVMIDVMEYGSTRTWNNSVASTISSGHTTTPFTIGGMNVAAPAGDASYWYGEIGKVAIYNKVLTNAQRDAHFAAMHP